MAKTRRAPTPKRVSGVRRGTESFDFDVAFSFLDSDKSLALALESRLQPHLNVFVYATRQKILAGTEGLESFRTVFLAQSRLVVVLYRAGWGQTKFTRIEETAIRDRGYDQHWEDFLLFVTMTEADPVPDWLPKHHIRLSYPMYGIDQLVGAIKVRAQTVGAQPHIEDAIQKAIRLEEESKRRQEREEALSGSQASLTPAQNEVSVVFDALDQRLAKLRSAVPSLKLEWRRDQIAAFEVRSARIGMNIVPRWEFPANNSVLQAFKFVGPIKFSNESGMYIPGPKHVGQDEFAPDFDQAYGGWCWKSGGQLQTSAQVAEQIANQIVELHDRVDRGELKRTLEDFWPGR